MNLLQDLRFGLRMVRKQPALAAIAMLALTLGIGLTTTMFSIIDGALLSGLPFRDADRLMHLSYAKPSEGIERQGLFLHDFLDYRAQQTSFVDLGAFYTGTVNLTGTDGIPERYDGAFITASTFPLLGVQPVLGRTFVEGENGPGAAPVVLLGYDLWANRFHSDPSILGRTVRTNGQEATVIGVMPEHFEFPINEQVWLPLLLDPDATQRGEGVDLDVVGRLENGVDREQAAAELGVLTERLGREYPDTNAGFVAAVKPFTQAFIGNQVAAMLWVMLAAVFSVLVIACVNVANLLLGRAAARSREAAIRTALGASRWRVMRQLLAETLILVLGGAAGGLLLAWMGIGLFNRAIASTDPPFWLDIRIGLPVLAFVALLAVLASLMAGVVPAMRVSAGDVNGVLKDEARGSSSLRLGRLSRGLVVLQLTFSCALLAGAGLMIKSIVQLRTVDLPFADEDVFSARVGLFATDYPDDPSRLRFFEQLIARLAQQPGAAGVAITSVLPGLSAPTEPFSFEGEVYHPDQSYPRARQAVISPGYFETLGLRLLEGREFGTIDRPEGAPVVIVNQGFVRRYLAGESPLGRRLRFGRGDSAEPWRTIIGVVPDLEMQGINEKETPEGVYLPLAQSPLRFASILVRTSLPPLDLAATVRQEVIALDPNLPLYQVDVLRDYLLEQMWFYNVFGGLFMVFGFAALLLASIGLYGVMAFSVSRRTQELGVRMALGARARDVVAMVLGQGMGQLGLGVLLGLGLALLLSQGLSVILFQVQPWDPGIFAAIAATLVLTGLLACYIPARRAARVDPVTALRGE